jgi:cytidine deaminase
MEKECMNLKEEQIQMLIQQAFAARQKAYAPYSGFSVGAALLDCDGKVHTGCNIENASYTPTNCGERTAFFKAISEGACEFRAIAIVGGRAGEEPKDFCPPCGVCRQVMMEFCEPEEFLVILAKSLGEYQIRTLAQLLPQGFGPSNL